MHYRSKGVYFPSGHASRHRTCNEPKHSADPRCRHQTARSSHAPQSPPFQPPVKTTSNVSPPTTQTPTPNIPTATQNPVHSTRQHRHQGDSRGQNPREFPKTTARQSSQPSPAYLHKSPGPQISRPSRNIHRFDHLMHLSNLCSRSPIKTVTSRTHAVTTCAPGRCRLSLLPKRGRIKVVGKHVSVRY